jgi:pimeloyl-ACP methyl ester carboxylesterase
MTYWQRLATVMIAIAAIGAGCAVMPAQTASGQAREASETLRAVPAAGTVGAQQWNYIDARWGPSRALTVFAYVPDTCATTPARCRVLLVMHGAERNARGARDVWAPHANRLNLIIVAPHFDGDRFPSAMYQRGGLATSANPDDWAYAVVDRLFTDAQQRLRLPQSRYSVYGHSAGGQFAQRMHLLAPHRGENFIAANAGYYTRIEWRPSAFAFPYSLAGIADGDRLGKAALARPLHILLGEADTDPQHPQLNRSPRAMAQGPHRLARGQSFMTEAKQAAAVLGVPLAWQMTTVARVGHESRPMAAAAAEILALVEANGHCRQRMMSQRC